MTKEGRPGLRRKQPNYSIGNDVVGSSKSHQRAPVIQKEKKTDCTGWINADEPGRSTHTKKIHRRRPVRNHNRVQYHLSSDSSSSTSSNSSNQLNEIISLSSSESERQRTPTPIKNIALVLDKITEEDISSELIHPVYNLTVDSHHHLDLEDMNVNDFPLDLNLPHCDTTLVSHNNWTVWRVYSEQIHSNLERHIEKFGGNYLSTILLGETFYKKINDDNVDYDLTVEFQAVQITKMHDIFTDKVNGEQRLSMDAVVVKTASNIYKTETETRLVYAIDSLAELLKGEVKKDDYMFIFSQNSLVNYETIALNSRHQQSVLIAVYRHDGVFCPEVDEDSDNPVISFDSKKFSYLFQEHEGPNEIVQMIKPRDMGRLVRATDLPVESSPEKVARFLNSSSNCSTPPEVNDEQIDTSAEQRESHSASISIGDFHEEILNCFESRSGYTPSPKMNESMPQPASKSNPQSSPCGNDMDENMPMNSSPPSPRKKSLSEVNNNNADANDGSQEKSSRKKKNTTTSISNDNVNAQSPEDSEQVSVAENEVENESISSTSSSMERLIIDAMYTTTITESPAGKTASSPNLIPSTYGSSTDEIIARINTEELEQEADKINLPAKLHAPTSSTLTTNNDDATKQMNVPVNPWMGLNPDTQYFNFTQESEQIHQVTLVEDVPVVVKIEAGSALPAVNSAQADNVERDNSRNFHPIRNDHIEIELRDFSICLEPLNIKSPSKSSTSIVPVHGTKNQMQKTFHQIPSQSKPTKKSMVNKHPQTKEGEQEQQSHKVTHLEEEKVSKVSSSRVYRDYKKEFQLKDCRLVLKRVKIEKTTSTLVTSKVKKEKSASPHKSPQKVQKRTGLRVLPRRVQQNENHYLLRRRK